MCESEAAKVKIHDTSGSKAGVGKFQLSGRISLPLSEREKFEYSHSHLFYLLSMAALGYSDRAE